MFPGCAVRDGGAPLVLKGIIVKSIRSYFLTALAAAVLCGGTVNARADAAGEYRSIIGELKAAMKNRTMSPVAYTDLVESRFGGFLKKYPDAPEAADAHLTLGQIYSRIGRFEDAVRHLGSFLGMRAGKPASELAVAKVILAGCHVSLENFDTAARIYRELVDSGRRIDPRVRKAASKELARIGTLKKLKIGFPAIEFSAVTTEGKRIKLADYRGKVVLLDFWASWCMPCKQELPNVKRVYGKYNKKGFEIIAISLDNDGAAFTSFVKEQNLPWPQVFDGKGWMGGVGQRYAVNSIPATFLLDRSGIIRQKGLRGEMLDKAVRDLLAEK